MEWSQLAHTCGKGGPTLLNGGWYSSPIRDRASSLFCGLPAGVFRFHCPKGWGQLCMQPGLPFLFVSFYYLINLFISHPDCSFPSLLSSHLLLPPLLPLSSPSSPIHSFVFVHKGAGSSLPWVSTNYQPGVLNDPVSKTKTNKKQAKPTQPQKTKLLAISTIPFLVVA